MAPEFCLRPPGKPKGAYGVHQKTPRTMFVPTSTEWERFDREPQKGGPPRRPSFSNWPPSSHVPMRKPSPSLPPSGAALTNWPFLGYRLPMFPEPPSHPSSVPSARNRFLLLLVCLGMGTSLPLQAQFGVATYTTNHLDIDVDGQVDFQFITQTSSENVPGPGGGTTLTSTRVTLVPQGSGRILSSKDLSPLNLPTFTNGTSIGPAGPNWVWSTSPALLLNAVEPIGLSGALAPVWMFTPDTLHIGIAIGSPESPNYGWMSFNRERRLRAPMAWGYSRTPGTPVIANDPATIPPFAVSITHTGNPDFLRLTWQPDFANMTVEQLAANGSWLPVEATSAGRLVLRIQPAEDIPRIFRTRYTP